MTFAFTWRVLNPLMSVFDELLPLMLMPSSGMLTYVSTIYTYQEASLIFNQLELEPAFCPILLQNGSCSKHDTAK